MDQDDGFSLSQQKILAIVPRIMSVVSLLSSLYIVVTVLQSKQNRSRVYHRLMLGTAFNMMALNIWQLWGTAAIPAGTLNVWGARGTTATCSAQGFLFQFGFTVPSYYCGLSFYSFVAVRSNFKLDAYAWIERWIHIGVWVYPLGSAIYLLSIEAFNYNGLTVCWINSAPSRCGEKTDMVCTRGPQNIGQIQWLFAAGPIMLVLLTPTITMVVLCVDLKRRQSMFLLEASTVAKQAVLYLLALYWTYTFTFIESALYFAFEKQFFSISLIASSVENLEGLWITLVYIGFRRRHLPTGIAETSQLEDQGESGQEKSTLSMKVSREILRKSFSIFDGTNPSGDWADFIFDGDDLDCDSDELEAEKWKLVVQR